MDGLSGSLSIQRARIAGHSWISLLFACILAVGNSTVSQGSIIDLKTGAGSQGSVNGGIYKFGGQSGGTGIIDPFVRIQSAQTESGYNTSASALPFDEKSGAWTHNLQLKEIPIISIDGVDYLEFLLDINEAGGGGNSYLSLDKIQIYTSSVGSQNTTVLGDLGDLRYDLDAGEDSHIRMDYSLNPGSGVTDMTAYIPISNFAGAKADDFVYFYSLFGELGKIGNRKYGSTNGFEEWAVQIDANSVFIPTPGSLALLGLGYSLPSPRSVVVARDHSSRLAILQMKKKIPIRIKVNTKPTMMRMISPSLTSSSSPFQSRMVRIGSTINRPFDHDETAVVDELARNCRLCTVAGTDSPSASTRT